MEHIANYIVKKLNDINPMSLEELETCKFGIYHNLYMILNILTSLIVGLLMHMLADTIILNIAYIAIRIQAGGHHASNPLKCFINSTLILIVDLLFIKYISFHVLVIIGTFILACSFIWHIAPVETRNHLLDAEEIQVFRKRSRIVLIAESIAFFRDANIYILDEPSSALDAESEDKLFKKFEEMYKDKGAILISHRLSNIIKSDYILVIDNGKVIEEGKHDDLIALNKKYAYMYNLQAQKYSL